MNNKRFILSALTVGAAMLVGCPGPAATPDGGTDSGPATPDGGRDTGPATPDTGVHPDLLNSRFGYVAVSRASHEATVFTDNLAKLNPQLSADVSKTSALEVSQTRSIGQARQ